MALVITDVSEERFAYIRLERINELQLLVTANVPSSFIISTLMMEVIGTSEMFVLTRPTRPHIPEDDVLHGECRENFKPHR
jgi:hypothetical protein